MIPGKLVKGMGGAMDLVASGSKVIVLMEHCNHKGETKLLEQCTLPTTGVNIVDKVITDKAVFERINGELILTEVAQESSVDEITSLTGFKFK